MSFYFRLVGMLTRLTLKPVFYYGKNINFLRKYWRFIAKNSFSSPSGIEYDAIMLSANDRDVSCIRTRVLNKKTRGILFYIHGGAFIFGAPETHQHLAADLASKMGLMGYLPRYGLAPEIPFPGGIQDIISSYCALLETGVDSRNIVLGGDSSGGCFVLLLLAYLAKENLPMPVCSFALSPVTDLTYSGESFRKNKYSDVALVADRFDFVNGLYLNDQDPFLPSISPLFAEYYGVTPILLHASEKEILCDDTLRMAEKLAKQKVDVTVKIWPNNYHVFHLLRGRIKEADQAVKDIVTFVFKYFPD